MKKARPSTPDSKLLSSLDHPTFADAVSQAIQESAAFYDPLTRNTQWIFDNAQFLGRDMFLNHITPDSWKHGHGFAARPCADDDGHWEILCPTIVHKTRVPIEFLTEFAANLPEGTKINMGGFKND